MIQAQLRAEKSKQKAAYALAQPAEKETKFLKTFATGEKELSDKELGTIYDYYKEQAQKSA